LSGRGLGADTAGGMGGSAVELVLFFVVIVFGMGDILLNYFDLLLFTLLQVLGIAAALAGIVYVI